MKSVPVLVLLITNVVFEVGSSFLHTEIEDEVETEIRDWSDAKTDGIVRSLSFVVGIDSSLTQYYNYDEEKIQAATVTLFHTVIQYFYPLNIRLTIVDILPVKGVKIGLDEFISWKKEQPNMVDHDVTILLRHNYEGGIANGDGLCTKESLIVSGFFPEATMNNAWVLIHQLAHVIGISHKITANCKCKGTNQEKCLKIRGFPKCSVQEMLNKLATKNCFMDNTVNFTDSEAASRIFSLPICGNGLLEKNEECDCGPQKFCDNPLCDAVKCKFVLEKKWLTVIIPGLAAMLSFLILLCIWKYGILKLFGFATTKLSEWIKKPDDPQMPNESQNTSETLTSLTAPPNTVVRMREPRDYETAVPKERRRTRFSDIYVQMRPISRFWEKFKTQNNRDPPPVV